MIHVKDVVVFSRFLINLSVHFGIRTARNNEQILDLLIKNCFVLEPRFSQYSSLLGFLDGGHDHNDHESVVGAELSGFCEVGVIVTIRNVMVLTRIEPLVCEG